MMRYLPWFISSILLTACASGPFPIPELSSIPWQYPQLSTTGCPELTGTYKLDAGSTSYNFIRTYHTNYDLMAVEKEREGFNLKYWNSEAGAHLGGKQVESVPIKIDGVEYGCANGKLISHYYDTYTGYANTGETPDKASLLYYYEKATIKLNNGDLDVQGQYGEVLRNFTRTYISAPSKTYHEIIKQASPKTP